MLLILPYPQGCQPRQTDKYLAVLIRLVPVPSVPLVGCRMACPLLQEAVTSRQPPQGYAERVLVFAETVAAANGVANALEAVGVTALLYHKGVSASDRAAALATMSKCVHFLGRLRLV